jgi:anti-sigma factor RsiW
MSDLEKLTKDYYDAARMSDERLDAIVRDTPPRTSSARTWYVRLAAVAATLMVGFGLLHVYLVERDTATRVLDEIAMNHRKQLAVEVVASDFMAIGKALDRLDFAVAAPRDIVKRFELLGGRYCSIQGGIAAQIKLRDRDTGDIRTLYATKLTPALAGIGESENVHGDVAISLWRDGEVFFGLARDAD